MFQWISELNVSTSERKLTNTSSVRSVRFKLQIASSKGSLRPEGEILETSSFLYASEASDVCLQ